jgi:Flp pilus assembly protein TadG
MKNVLKRQGGVAMVELAIVLPLYMMLIAGIIEFGNVLMQLNTLNKAAMDASRYLSIYAKQGAGDYDIENLKMQAQNLLQCGKTVSCVTSLLPSPPPIIVEDTEDNNGYAVDSTTGVITFAVTYTYQPFFNVIFGTNIDSHFTLNSTIVVQAL